LVFLKTHLEKMEATEGCCHWGKRGKGKIGSAKQSAIDGSVSGERKPEQEKKKRKRFGKRAARNRSKRRLITKAGKFDRKMAGSRRKEKQSQTGRE